MACCKNAANFCFQNIENEFIWAFSYLKKVKSYPNLHPWDSGSIVGHRIHVSFHFIYSHSINPIKAHTCHPCSCPYQFYVHVGNCTLHLENKYSVVWKKICVWNPLLCLSLTWCDCCDLSLCNWKRVLSSLYNLGNTA